MKKRTQNLLNTVCIKRQKRINRMEIWDNINDIARELLGDTKPPKVNLSEISKEVNRPNDITEKRGNKKAGKQTDVSDIEVLPEYQFILKAIQNKCPAIFVTGRAGTGVFEEERTDSSRCSL
jgi:ATP-dependent DNA helicase PIF1